jgi:hypothetical protein
MDKRTEGLPFSGDECWDAFVDPTIQSVLVPWRELISEHAQERDREWLGAFPLVAYAVVLNFVEGEKTPRRPFEILYERAPLLVAELLFRLTIFLRTPESEWGIDRLINYYSRKFTGHFGGPGPSSLRLLDHGEIAMRFGNSVNYPEGCKDHVGYIRKRYSRIKARQKQMHREWASAITLMPGLALGVIDGWLKRNDSSLKTFICKHGSKLKHTTHSS